MSNSFICFIRECVDKVSNVKVPDYIIENVAELIGTLVATVLIAIVTTYIFNRQQEINKVKARVFRYRLNMYEDITRYLEKYDHMMSLSNDREHIIDALSKVDLSVNTIDWAVVGMLTEPDEIKNALAEVDRVSIKGIYILDDDVLAKVLILKMYLMNLQQYSILVDSYKSGVKQRKLSETEMKLAKELFFRIMQLS